MINKDKILKELEKTKRIKRRRVKKFRDFIKTNKKSFEFISVASSPLPGPMSVDNIEIK